MVDTDLTYGQVTQDVLEPLFTMGKAYMAALGLVGLGLAYGGWCIIQRLVWGLGVAGYSQAVFWGLYITTFVFWIGIGHAGAISRFSSCSARSGVQAFTERQGR